MAVLKEKDRKEVGQLLAGLTHDVRLLMFTQEHECQWCETTRELVTEVAELAPKLNAEIHDFVAEKDLAGEYGIRRVPAIVVMGARDVGIRFYGVPAGYEFAALLEAIQAVGRNAHGLPDGVITELSRIEQPVHLQVMVTPTCPYCAPAVVAAHRLAMASDQISADMVEVSEFPQIAMRYQVQGVPKTIINEDASFVGSQPVTNVVQEILKAVGGA
ncbi:MAG: glutaredoxin [Candidatus Eisenbacteria bacterium]|nr:glutaredoxin [Candidatus Eisenbacteria bacterium]